MTLLPPRIVDVWVYLSTSPLLWLTLTLAAYAFAARVAAATSRHPLANPVIIATAILVALLAATGTDYADYFAGAQFVHFLLGPTTVALAVPLYRNRRLVIESLLPMLCALFAGSLTAIGSAVAIAKLFGATPDIVASIAPKSVTAPIAMSLAERIGGIPTLSAVLVITTGIVGAITVTPLMNLLRIRNYRARGFAAGLAAHGIGTARAFEVDSVAGTFAGIAMALNGLLTSILIPLLAPLWH